MAPYRAQPFEILNKYSGSQLKRLRSGTHCGLSSETRGDASNSEVSSAVSIMRRAKIELHKKRGDSFSTLEKLSEFEHAKHLRRVLLLLDAAEKFSNKKYHQAEELLDVLACLDSHHSDHRSVERVVGCFAQDLRERIDARSEKIAIQRGAAHVDIEQMLMDLKAAINECEQKLPFNQITHFTAIQTIIDSLSLAARIHFIDIGKKLGSQWILMMHALANRKNCQLEQLKITVVCTPKDNVEETGELLLSFAESMNLPFSFKTLHSEMHEIKKDEFELEEGETVAVFLECCLISLSACPENVGKLIKGLKDLNPHVMVASELEMNTVGSTFTQRFHEAFLISSAMFDCLEDCHERGNRFKEIVVKAYFQEVIKNGILSEEEEGFRRYCKIDFWRELFTRNGVVETDLSPTSMCQASLLIRESPCWKCCTLSMNGKCMLLGWNGVPLRSVSAWKFQNE